MRHPNPPRATLDFETRSACSLKNCGSWRYSLDPTTAVLCLAFRLPYWPKGKTALWHPAFPHLGIEEDLRGWDDESGAWYLLSDLFEWINDGGIIEAHNAWFERGIWVNQMMAKHGWPYIKPLQWRCSAAKAAAHALPRKLELVGDALHLGELKDEEGSRLMKEGAKPRKPIAADWKSWGQTYAPCLVCEGVGKYQDWNKNGTPRANLSKCPFCNGLGYDRYGDLPEMPLLWHESRERFEDLWDYCRQDVLAEEAVSDRLRDLNVDETDYYIMDQMVNERGFMLDMEAVRAALNLIDVECVDLNAELTVLTDGVVAKATQRDQMMEWLETQGLSLWNTRKETIQAVLDGEVAPYEGDELPPKARRGLELMKILGRSSTAKFVKMASWVCPDQCIHGGLLFNAATTGRWGGQGVQPHNFVRSVIGDMDAAWNIIKTEDRERITREVVTKKGKPVGTTMDVLAHALRGAIVPRPGNQLYVSDFAGIEARVLMWLANDQGGLDVFRNHLDVYCEMASKIFGRPISKEEAERQLGKAAILGLGYQMGAAKFVATAATYGVDLLLDVQCAQCGMASNEHRRKNHEFIYRDGDEDRMTAVKVVKIYRDTYWRVVRMWKDVEDAAIDAVLNPRYVHTSGKVEFYCDDGFLFCQLPSGRSLAYPEPEMRQTTTSWGALKNQLTFMTMSQYTHQWVREGTYGGKIVENIDQAVSRDLLAHSMWQLEQSGIYLPVLSVHDEILAEACVGKGDVGDFTQRMLVLPKWAEGLPLEAESWSGFRYRK